ncbi:MAG: sugar phosphate isomerase/epimerase family protein [Christensenellales bacterium]
MEIGMSTASFFGLYHTEDALKQIGDMGLSLCEVFLDSYTEYDEAFAHTLNDIACSYGLRVHSVHAMGTQFEPQLFSVNKRQKKDAFHVLGRVMQAAKILGAQCFVFHGPLNLKRSFYRRNYETFCAQIDEITSFCQDYGIKLAWENVHWCAYSAPGFAEKLRKRCRTDNLYYTLDLKQAAFSGYSIEEYIEDMDGDIVNLHICDFRISGGEVRPLLPGAGECDWEAVGAALDRQGYAGPAIIEVYQDSRHGLAELSRSVEWVKGVLG